MLPLNWFKIIPLKFIEYSYSHFNVYLLVFMQGILIRVKICIVFYLYVTYGHLLLQTLFLRFMIYIYMFYKLNILHSSPNICGSGSENANVIL